MIFKLLFSFCGLSLIYSAKAQNISYARFVIDTLCSPYMAGRGGPDEGEKKAAHYIAGEFKTLELSPLGDNYLQPFTYPLTTFNGKMSVYANDKALEPGVDFLVNPSSASINGTFDLVWYNKNNIPDKKTLCKLAKKNFFTHKLIVLDLFKAEESKKDFDFLLENPMGASGIILLKQDKLTWGKSTSCLSFASIEIKANALPLHTKKITLEIENTFLKKFESHNVIGYLKGAEVPDSLLVFTAHYDHLGKMGHSVYFPGANDNASGVAMLLNLAEYFSKTPHRYSTVFIAFGGEEAGLLGSAAFIQQPLIPLNKIKFLINFDITGTGDEGVTVVNATMHEKEFLKMQEINSLNHYLKQVKKRGPAANSDHYFFAKNGVPCFYIYTMGGISAYHDIYDRPETLPLTKFEDYFRLIRDFCLSF
ncbi:MAG: M28 family peptidase [Bacteroidetes bacterium]|nr:M28 family peptidase [Bacteroidota bacterium]MBV6460780.1 hypothetical protein [Flavobacteriales bacterium]WKZ75779.1 MAG: M28 family peptidase [Vicingaceae bacterium]MCL4817454.1 M28 family peptidase [Flavobacteriales bacterium]NOG96230.1 M28 family peptidase [Bacteroidota bacterium]